MPLIRSSPKFTSIFLVLKFFLEPEMTGSGIKFLGSGKVCMEGSLFYNQTIKVVFICILNGIPFEY